MRHEDSIACTAACHDSSLILSVEVQPFFGTFYKTCALLYMWRIVSTGRNGWGGLEPGVIVSA